MRPGHHWFFKFGDAGDGTRCEKEFNLTRRTWEDYKGTRFYNGQQGLVVERWLNRVEEDASGLTIEKWNPTQDADALQPPGCAHQLVGIACGRFHVERSDSSSAGGSGARRQVQVRGGSASISG